MPRGVPAASQTALTDEEREIQRQEIAQRKWETAVARLITQLGWAKTEKDYDLVAVHAAKLYELTKPDETETGG